MSYFIEKQQNTQSIRRYGGLFVNGGRGYMYGGGQMQELRTSEDYNHNMAFILNESPGLESTDNGENLHGGFFLGFSNAC